MIRASIAEAFVLASPLRADDGFSPLFNGKDLTGWRYAGQDVAGKTAKDGVLVVEGSPDSPPMMTEIDTSWPYDGDFTLRLESQLQIRHYPDAGPYMRLAHYKAGDWNAGLPHRWRTPS